MKYLTLHNFQILFMILCGNGVTFVITGMFLDDRTFWFISDMYFVAVFSGSVIVFYLTIRQYYKLKDANTGKP